MDDPGRLIARIIDGVSLAFGIAAEILAVWAVDREFAIRGVVQLSAALVIVVFLSISAFCCLVGFRLAFNRPNRHGSVLPPLGWKTLGFSFSIVALTMAAIGLGRGKYQLLGAAVGLGLLGLVSVLAGRVVSNRLPWSPVFPPDTALLRMKAGFTYGVAVLVGLTLSCISLLSQAPSFAAETKECGLKRVASLDLVLAGNGYLLVPVTFQETRVYMVLNLANGLSTVTESAVRRLSLKPNSIPNEFAAHAEGKVIQKLVTATPFAMGELRFKSANFWVLPKYEFRADLADAPVVGVLGADAFARVDIELDVAHRKLNLFSPDHCPGHTVYWSAKCDSAPIRIGSLGEFYFPMELDGRTLETTLATSNGMTTLHTDATRSLYNFDNHSPDVQTEVDGAGRTTAQYRAMKLSGEGIEIINARISLVDFPSNSPCRLSSHLGAASYENCRGAHPLSLGQDVISKLHLYIATKEKMLYFTPANPTE